MTKERMNVGGREVRFVAEDDENKLTIDSMNEIPVFASEADEQAWWETHDFSDKLLEEAARAERKRRARGEPGNRPADVLARSRPRSR